MSHVTVLRGVVIKDIRAFMSAVAEIQEKGVQCTLVQNAKPRVHGYDSAPVCDHVLKLNGVYDVGFKKNDKGEYEPVFDTYQGHVGRELGAQCPLERGMNVAQHQMGQFLQSYAKHAAMNTAMAAGHVIESCTVDQNGDIQLVTLVA